MKKILCVLTAILLLASSAAFAEEEPLYPEGYNLLKIVDIFTNNDSETGEDVENLLLQATLGALGTDTTEDAALDSEAEDEDGFDPETELIGFDMDDVYTFGLAEGCEILLPADPLDPTEIVQIDDLQAWYDKANEIMADYFDEGQTSYEFYATFEVNDVGDLTKLEYLYFDWQ